MAPAVAIAIVFFAATYWLGPALFDADDASLGRAFTVAIAAFVGWYAAATVAGRRKPDR